MLRFDFVIFDLDGTLLDTSKGILDSVKDTIKFFGKAVPSDDSIRKFIGPPIQNAFRDYYCLTKEEADQMADYFRNQYKDVHLLKAEPYPGIYDLLLLLRKLRMHTAVATNKRIDYTEKLLDSFGMLTLFDCVCGSDFEQKLKKPDIIKEAIDKVESLSLNAVMIGDAIGDYEGAMLCGLPFIGVTYGFGFETKEEILSRQGAVYATHSIADLKEFLCEDIK